MRSVARQSLATVVVALIGLPAFAQNQVPPPAAPTPTATAAATVNGQPVLEAALQRGLQFVPENKRAEVRAENLETLINNLLVEQYLVQLNVAVDPKEVEAAVEEIRAELKKVSQTLEAELKRLKLGEDELRTQITADLRWNKFVKDQANDKVLTEFFNANREMFDGTVVRARHILLTPASNDAKAEEQARTQLLLYKKQIEEQAAAGLAKLPPDADNLAREQARTRLLDDAFAAVAREKSTCPSRERGGDVDWFPRVAGMVEPFARAAFALKPYQMSDPVRTQFGYHLILLTDRKPGKDTKFEDVKEEVKEIYSVYLKDALAARLRQTAKLVYTPTKP
jgi:parvulin-like peptidyl-prolyl isomerase